MEDSSFPLFIECQQLIGARNLLIAIIDVVRRAPVLKCILLYCIFEGHDLRMLLGVGTGVVVALGVAAGACVGLGVTFG